MTDKIGRLALIGVGLINGSLSLALQKRGLVADVVGCARNAETRERAIERGLCAHAEADPAAAVQDADIVVLGVPPGAIGPVAEAMAPGLGANTIVTDVASIKAHVVDVVRPHLPNPALFVPGHPVAGTEHSGPDAAFDSLFERRRGILTPLADADPGAVTRIRQMWEAVGMSIDLMTPNHHDKVLAITSHIPHLIAYSIVGTVGDLEDQTQSEVFRYAAGGFTDFTRIAASDPVMWRDVFLHNQDAVLEMLGRVTEDLIALQRSIRWGEGDRLEDLFIRTRGLRRGVIQAGEAYVRQAEDPLAEQ
ncbi:MAG: prephenate/arogenate dehydrogenase family protein [Geminicoccaceae bacterium]